MHELKIKPKKFNKKKIYSKELKKNHIKRDNSKKKMENNQIYNKCQVKIEKILKQQANLRKTIDKLEAEFATLFIIRDEDDEQRQTRMYREYRIKEQIKKHKKKLEKKA